MPKFIIPLVAALLLLPACGNCKRPCSNRYCPPTAPTRPICPEAKPACGCKNQKPRCRQRQRATPCRTTGRHVTLSEVMDYLPGLPPGYGAS